MAYRLFIKRLLGRFVPNLYSEDFTGTTKQSCWMMGGRLLRACRELDLQINFARDGWSIRISKTEREMVIEDL